MFGKKQIQALEDELQTVKTRLGKATTDNNALTEQLKSANARIARLEAELQDYDVNKLREEANALKAEYEGLRDLYKQKNQEFDDALDAREQSFARDQAIQRHNLENEIRDNRQANQDYVARTVRTFGQSYNHYLNQIKMMMDALSNVATRTGETLFSQENANLSDRFGTQMREYLKSGDEPFDEDETACEEAPLADED